MFPSGLSTTYNFLLSTAPIWVPALMLTIFAIIWLRYKRIEFLVSEGGVLLEIKLPKEVTKTPLAMELVLTAMHQAGKGDYLATFMKGKTRPPFALELVSIDGQVHFFIWTRPKLRNIVETQLYAHYPGIEVVEAEDYTKRIFHNTQTHSFWGMAFKLTKDDVYPIKTYVDYGLDKPGEKEENKIDPLNTVLEFLGSLKRGEQVWIQIMIQAHRSESFKDDALFFSGRKDWKDAAKAEVKKKLDELKDGDKIRQATEYEKEVLDALQRSQSKFAFEVGLRGMYIAEKNVFNPTNIPALIGSVRQYSSNTLNGFKPSKATSTDLPWQDFRKRHKLEMEEKMLNAVKLRSFFNVPYRHFMAKPFVLTTEEIATMFHLPGAVATTPTLLKTQSRKGQAPTNLPI